MRYITINYLYNVWSPIEVTVQCEVYTWKRNITSNKFIHFFLYFLGIFFLQSHDYSGIWVR